MELPFPGMDPYLEQHSRWPDVHTSLIAAMRDAIQARLNPNYVAVITPYIAYENIEISPTRQTYIPDIGILREERLEYGDTAVAIAEAPLTIPGLMDIPTRYARIELRSVTYDRLVTTIELLSPANKRPGAEGADAYQKKRQELFMGGVHLLEIDLLRGGQRPHLSRPIPNTAYCVLLSRAQGRPLVNVWPIPLQQPLPVVPVPLLEPDPDVPLPLNQILHEVYRKAQYQRQIDYQADPPLPELGAEDAAWLHAHLLEQGLRQPIADSR